MGVIGRLLGLDKLGQRGLGGSDGGAGAEQRDVQMSRELLNTLRAQMGSGGPVTPSSAMQIATVYTCAKVLAEGIGQLPLIVYERLERGKKRATGHPLYQLLHALPNPELTSIELRMLLMGHAVVWGNGYGQLVRNGAGRITEVWPLRPDLMQIYRSPAEELIYEYNSQTLGQQVFVASEIFHLRGFGFDGIKGYSAIAMNERLLSGVESAQAYGNKFYENGARPGIMLRHPGKLSDKAYKRMMESWEARHQGVSNSHRMALLEEGMDVTEVGIPPGDAQFLQTRQLQRSEISALFRVPLHMINDLERSAFSNIEQQSLEFVIYTLGPWLALWEQAIGRDMLLPAERGRYFAEFLVDGLLRGDTTSRHQAYQSGILSGWLTPNEARERENLNPLPGGDELLLPMNTSAGNPTGGTGQPKGQ